MQRSGLVPPVCFLVSVIAMICLAVFVPGTRIVPFPWNLLGLLPFVAGAALSVAVDRAFRKNAVGGEGPDEPAFLITTGIFRISRNPMYLGHLLMLVGLALCLGALIPLLIIPMFFFFVQLLCVTAEEQMMEERFGSAWSRYRSEVRRWL
jgi:protein-S-isoprenylcysteine O-methyltransferase Ste14